MNKKTLATSVINSPLSPLYLIHILFSCGKGIAQTLARRATHFLSSGQLNLALRDLAAALEYGCLQTELLDLLLSHHKPKNSTKKVCV